MLGAIGAIACGLGAVLGVPLLDRLAIAMPAQWMNAVEQRSPWLFIAHWGSEDWNVAATAILGCALVATRVPHDLRRLFVSASVTAIVGIVVAIVGGDLFNSVLILQIQPWRSVWIAEVVAVAGAGLLWAKYIVDRRADDLIAAFALSSALLLITSAGSAAVALALIVLYCTRSTAGRRYIKWGLVLSGLVFVQAIFWHTANYSGWYWMHRAYAQYPSLVPILVREPVVVCCVAGVLAWLVRHRTGTAIRAAATACALLLVGVGIVSWVEAYEADRSLRHGYTGLDEIRRRVPPDKGILWGDDANVAWFVLHRPSYLSVIQTAGIVFSERTAMEAQRRAQLMERVLGPQPYMRWTVPEFRPAALDMPAIAALCRDAELGGVFTQDRRVAGGVAIGSEAGRHIGRFIVCDDLRAR